jgi:hypothetical protein
MKFNGWLLLAAGFVTKMSLASELPLVMPEAQSCQITGTQNEVAYGSIRRDQFLSQKMPERRIRITARCRYPQPLSLKINGLNSNKDFSWGHLGRIRLSIANATLDNHPVAILLSDDATLVESNEKRISPGQNIAPAINGEMAMGNVFSFDLIVNPGVNQTKAAIAEQQFLDTTINILFN